VLLRGSPNCQATLEAADALGKFKALQTTDDRTLRCASIGAGGGTGCTLQIIQTECER